MMVSSKPSPHWGLSDWRYTMTAELPCRFRFPGHTGEQLPPVLIAACYVHTGEQDCGHIAYSKSSWHEDGTQVSWRKKAPSLPEGFHVLEDTDE